MSELLDHFRIATEGERYARACRFLEEVGATYLGWAGLWAAPAGGVSEGEERNYGLVRADAPGPIPRP